MRNRKKALLPLRVLIEGSDLTCLSLPWGHSLSNTRPADEDQSSSCFVMFHLRNAWFEMVTGDTSASPTMACFATKICDSFQGAARPFTGLCWFLRPVILVAHDGAELLARIHLEKWKKGEKKEGNLQFQGGTAAGSYP